MSFKLSEPAVSIQGLGKRYRLRHQQEAPYVALRDVLASALAAPVRWLRARPDAAGATEEFWALRDVSFDVMRGEVVGIIGRNGAGKSTLLKVLSRITEPTAGRVTIDGRVASLLEVGTGFHPELTGRENIYLNAAILGMPRAETARKFDEIVAFADVARFLDTPVKRYSSGMYVRLAFAVAAHLEPDVLIVDEVLAVGDAEFQKKSLGKMRDASRGGRTVLFVSHNMAAVQALCSRAIWLHDGRVAAAGGVAETVAQYLTGGHAGQPRVSEPVRLGEALELRRFELTPAGIESGGPVGFTLTFGASQAARIVEVALLIYSSLETRIAIADLRAAGVPADVGPGRDWTLSGSIASLPLVEGDYRFGVYVNGTGFIGDRLDLLELRVRTPAQAGAYAPYPAEHRGFLELDVRVQS